MLIISEWLVLLLNAASMIVLAEVGFRFGRRLHRTGDTSRKELIGGVEATVLGLLALLLGFTFAMAIDRYEQRRSLVLQEANAIGTTYLRASLLPPAHQEPVRAALRRYLDVRINARKIARDQERFLAALRTSTAIQRELWNHASAAGREEPGEMTSLFIESLNQTIDTDAERLAAGRAEIPLGVWLLLLVVAGCGAMTTGYRAGAENARTMLATWFQPLLITFVIVLIFDLSHPLQGVIDISQQPLLDLRQSLLVQ